MTATAIPNLDNVRSIVPAQLRRHGHDLESKLVQLLADLTFAPDLTAERVHLVGQLDDIIADLGLLR